MNTVKGTTMNGNEGKEGREVDGEAARAAEEAWIEKLMERRAARVRAWKSKPKALRVLIVLALVADTTTIVGLVVMGLWNALIPAIFAGPAITWPQALGLFALGRILFGGWGRGRGRGPGGHWRGRWQERMEGLSPEERERMKTMLRGRCGPRASHA